MGFDQNIAHDRFPRRTRYQFMKASVCFHYDTDHRLSGVIVRDDAEAPHRTVIVLRDGRVVLGTECQYSPIADGADDA